MGYSIFEYSINFMGYPLALLLASIMFLIASLHIYWTLGGKWGLDGALPASESGAVLLEVGPVLCLVVAICFLACTYYYVALSGSYMIVLPNDYKMPAYFPYGALAIGIVFFLRAIGDFKYVGFFKSVRNTHFGRLDSKYFSPLCLFIGLASLGLFLLSNS